MHINKEKPGMIRAYALSIVWRKLLDEYIARFGFSENFLEIIRKEKEIAMHRVKRIVDSDRSVNAFIQICQQELTELQKAGQGGDFWQSKAFIEKGMGIKINPFECSVGEFYSYFKTIATMNKRTSNE